MLALATHGYVTQWLAPANGLGLGLGLRSRSRSRCVNVNLRQMRLHESGKGFGFKPPKDEGDVPIPLEPPNIITPAQG